jgi:orotidine-5'-phosphate decarboxylase
MTFTEKLTRSVQSTQSLLCVGLDPVVSRIPRPLREKFTDDAELIFEFCRRVVETAKPHACAFKPNMAFFEALGAPGWEAFEKLMDVVPSNRILIADAKRGDIGSTADKYKEAFFDRIGADAITLNPFMGLETILPYTGDLHKGVFVLVMTSNSGAADFMKRRFEGRTSLSEYIAEELSKLQSVSKTHLGMVIGATQASDLQPVLKAHPSSHLLIPGIGTQGGSLSDLKTALSKHRGIPIINSSRSIIYAGHDHEDWIEHILNKTLAMKESLMPITRNYVS